MIYEAVAGSSPRMRGKQRTGHRVQAAGRIIPAHAGQTGSVGEPEGREPDHPRACGANWGHRRPNPLKTGSSPRMRGKLIRDLDGDHRVRIIPAHAGQTHEAHI